MKGPTLEELRERRTRCRSHVGIVAMGCVGPDRRRARALEGVPVCEALTSACEGCTLRGHPLRS